MNVSLDDLLEKPITRQLKFGRYSNASEVVKAGLRLLEEKEMKITEMEKETRLGPESGTSEPWDKKEFLRKARKLAHDLGLD